MATAEAKLITAEEYARIPERDGFTDELIEGEIVYRPYARALHGLCCGNLCMPFHEYRRDHGGTATLRCGIVVGRNPDSVLGPDASYWKVRPSKLEQWPTTPPAAVFEVVDHDEPDYHVIRKVQLYLRFGVGIVWVVAPRYRTVTEYRADSIRMVDEGDVLDGGDVLPGFACKVADLFT